MKKATKAPVLTHTSNFRKGDKTQFLVFEVKPVIYQMLSLPKRIQPPKY